MSSRCGGHECRTGQRAWPSAFGADCVHGVSALNPEIMGMGPVAASEQAMKRAGMIVSDVDLVEINEAFAAQVIPSARKLTSMMQN